MNTRAMIKWGAVGYAATIGTFIITVVIKKLDGVSSENVIANFAMFMVTQFYPLFAIILVVLPYSVFTKRWHAILGACIGNVLFLPLTFVLGCILDVVVGSPISAWQEGWHIVAVALVVAYCSLAFFLIRRWLRGRRSEQASRE